MKMNTDADINAHQSWQIVETLGLYLLRLLDESMKEQTNLSRYSYIFLCPYISQELMVGLVTCQMKNGRFSELNANGIMLYCWTGLVKEWWPVPADLN